MTSKAHDSLAQGDRVTVVAPARLHLGFMDMHGGLGRNFGSLGVTLAGVATRLCISVSDHLQAHGPGAERAVEFARAVLDALNLSEAVSIDIDSIIPEHAGLGSGTQMALAVSAGIDRLFGTRADARKLAGLTARGQRSGIGIGAFREGGFLVDGGRGEGTLVPPIVARLPFPPHWRFLLIFDHARDGLHGQKEVQAFQAMRPMSAALAGDLCRRVLMQLLPALTEEDFGNFSDAVTYIQERVGDQFASFQGGRYASSRVAGVLAWLRDQGISGLGQSSWGPTGFALCESAVAADRLMRTVQDRFGADPELSFRTVRANNEGAAIAMQERERSGSVPRRAVQAQARYSPT
jgi:beta-RFAP synthase